MYYRSERDFFTMNPFNKSSFEESRRKCIDYIDENLKEKECPKCGKVNNPITTFFV
jgi:hypothetical protein